jgi:hypothetical protein
MLGFEGTVVSSRDWDVFRAGVRPWHGGSACGVSSPPFRTNNLAPLRRARIGPGLKLGTLEVIHFQ